MSFGEKAGNPHSTLTIYPQVSPEFNDKLIDCYYYDPYERKVTFYIKPQFALLYGQIYLAFI